MKKYLPILIMSVFFLFSCSDNIKQKKNVSNNSEVEIPMKYAKHFKIFKSDSTYRIEILDKSKKIQEFKISDNYKNKDVLKTPFSRFVATSTTHLGYIETLNVREKLVGFPSTNYISDSIFHNMVINKQITELGTAESMNLERLFELDPDVIFDFPNPISESQKQKLSKAGLKTIVITEFYEESALGKAEWIKLFGLLLGKAEFAKEKFNNIEKRYLALKDSIANVKSNKTVFSGIMFGDTWYAPAGNSFKAKNYSVAGANYVWKSDTLTGSITFSFEKVYKDAVNTDYWIGVGGQKSLKELVVANSNYKLFKAFKNKNIFSVYGKTTEWGANAYFEKGVLEPDVVLKDLIMIFDDNTEDSKLIYHKRLE